MTMRRWIAAAAAIAAALVCVSPSHVVSAAAVRYAQVRDWAQLPNGTKWGVMSWVSTDAADNVYALQRDAPTSKVLVFDANGRFLRAWGEGVFPYAHAIRILPDGAAWVTDRKLQQIVRFDLAGRRSLAIGQEGVAGGNDSRSAFNGVSDVVMAPDRTLFASDGEGGNARVVHLSADGRFLSIWGTKGGGAGELNGPHCIAMDKARRLYVCDRGNKRIEVFDANGRYVSEMRQFGTPVSIAIDAQNRMFVASPAPENHVVIGTTAGEVLQTISGLNAPHGIAVDSHGNIYVAESAGQAVLKYSPS
jgi:DNA-binding beta-propeller fold protein YncE